MVTPANMPDQRPSARPGQSVSTVEPVFVDDVTGETGVMLQRADAVFCFHPHTGGEPRPILEPGRYRSTEPSRGGHSRRRRPGRHGRRSSGR